MSLPRRLEPEWLDHLPADDPRAMRSRRDLTRVNSFMGNASRMADALLQHSAEKTPRTIVDLGSGDGQFMLQVARRLAPRWRGEANPAVHKAAGPGEPVTQEVAVSVKGDKVECAINGTVVGSYDKAALVVPGKLKSTDGVYGIRFAHNTDATVTGLAMTKN